MPPDLPDAVRPLLARLAAVLDRDPALRAELAGLARAVAAWIDPPAAGPPPPAPEPAPVVVAEAPADGPPPAPAEPPVSVAELAARLFPPTPPPAPLPRQFDPEPDGYVLAPLATVAARCRLKAEAARADRADRAAVGGLIDRARALPDCFLWAFHPDQEARPPKVWADLATAYEAAAAGADLLAAWDRLGPGNRGGAADAVLHLAAEAQSTLRSAVADAKPGVRFADTDQVQLFAHTREAGRREGVYVRRYLRQDEWADPAGGPGVAARAAGLAADLSAAGARERDRRKALNNLKHKAGRLAPDADDPDEWRRVIELVDGLVAGGLPPSNAELRDVVLPWFDRLADWPALPPGVERVLREVDRYLAGRPRPQPAAGPDPPSREVAEVASLLAGREAVLIGGQVRPDRRDALARAFGLAGVNWLTTPEHTSFTVFEAPVARPEVAVVLLATRWISHDYQNVKEYCDRYGKAFVKLPAGYHPNQVAHQILVQAGDRLRAAAGQPAS